ncbi:MAG: hypothetical protein F4X12_12970 [Acidobacteriia bacterium]|nr:hypothetical protein [Terriglobia bacterium]
MTSVTFSISRVNRLRNAAARARAPVAPTEPVEPDAPWLEPEEREGWSISDCDPNNLLGVFKALRLRAGFAVHAYEFRAGGNGNGIIWAVPADAPLLAPEDCPRLRGAFLDPPKPPGAIPLMEAIDGDGSPWSYLSASILAREAAEFGARWHGCVWSDQKIIGKPPREGGWGWRRPVPRVWTPTYAETGPTRTIVLYIRNPVGMATIYRATDTYSVDSYDCETETEELGEGPGGFIY